jgi:hypothetical protein
MSGRQLKELRGLKSCPEGTRVTFAPASCASGKSEDCICVSWGTIGVTG